MAPLFRASPASGEISQTQPTQVSTNKPETTSSMSAVTVPALKKHTATVIFMHGLGDSGNGWRFLAEEYRKLKVLDHVKFVFPNAPVQRVTVVSSFILRYIAFVY